MKSILRKEVLIGLLVIVAMLILFFGINYLKGINIFKASNYYYSVYNNVEGLAQSAPVTLNGFKVGIVRSINYDFENPGNVVVEISLDKSLKLPQGTQAYVGADLLGTASITLDLGTDRSSFYSVGDTIPGSVKAGMMAGISENILPAVSSIMPKIDSLLTNLNTLTGNPALHESITRLDAITTELHATMRSLNAVTAELRPIAGNIHSITNNVDTITGDLTQVSGRLRTVPVDSIAAEIQATMTNLRQLSESLNNPDSSIGKLTNDPELYNNINSTITSLDSLFTDIKKNPKRYINIKVF